MRKRSLFLMLVVLIATMVPFVAGAKVTAQTTTGYKTTFRIQNLSTTTDAICSYDVYDSAGNNPNNFLTTQLPSAIKPNSSAVVTVADVANFPTGTNAAVISCSEQVAVNVIFNDATKTDAYSGISSPSTTLWLPRVFRQDVQGYVSNVRLQNATSSANTGKIEYFLGAVKKAETPLNLAANAAITIPNAAMEIGKSYSAKITMSQPAAAVVTIFGKAGTTKANRLRAYEAFTDGTTQSVYAPVLMRNYSPSRYDTVINIQNIGDKVATVKVKYLSAGVAITRKFLVYPDQTRLVGQNAETSLPTNKVFSARIWSAITPDDPTTPGVTDPVDPQKIIVTVDEISEFYSRDTTYRAEAVGGTKIAIPYVVKHLNSYNSSVTCQNTGTVTITSISAKYFFPDGTSKNSGLTNLGTGLISGRTKMIYQPAEDTVNVLPNGSVASMLIEVTGTATVPGPNDTVELSCVANVDQTDGTTRTLNKDRLAAYNGTIVP